MQPTEKYEHGESFTFPIRLAIPSYKRILNRNIPLYLIGATNQMLDNYDCASSEKIILMNKDEHMPWMKKKHSEYLIKSNAWRLVIKIICLKTDTMSYGN